MKNYFIAWLLTLGGGGICLAIGYPFNVCTPFHSLSHFQRYALSTLHYAAKNPSGTSYFDRDAFTSVVILLNVFALLLFTVFQYFLFNGKKELAEPKYLAALAVACAVSRVILSMQVHVFDNTSFSLGFRLD